MRKESGLCAALRIDANRQAEAPHDDNVSNVYVNDNGKLNLDKSNVHNDNSTRALMMTIFLQIKLAGFFANRLFVYEFRLSELVVLINLSRFLSVVPT